MKKLLLFIIVLGTLFLPAISAKAQPYVGEIRSVGFNFAPAGWESCDGQLLLISENETLFQLIGTTYGGDGQTTFALPNLNGRVPVGQGTGYVIGEQGGTETTTLTINQIPAHTHSVLAQGAIMTSTQNGDSASPSGAVLAEPISGVNTVNSYINTTGPINLLDGTTLATYKIKQMAPNTVAVDMKNATLAINPSAVNQPFNNMQPYLATNYIISLFGIYPTQN